MPPNNNYLTSQKVRDRFGGVSDMTLWRWLNDEDVGFPQPLRVNGRRYWKAGDLDAWEMSMRSAQERTS